MKPIPIRFWVGCLLFYYTFCNNMERAGFSISTLDIVTRHNETFHCKNVTRSTLRHPLINDESHFQLSELQQNFFLASYFLGYIPAAFASGYIVFYVGAWNCIFYSISWIAILNVFIPVALTSKYYLAALLRFLIGALHAIEYPACFQLIMLWAPDNERYYFFGAICLGTLGVPFSWTIVAIISEYISWSWGFHFESLIQFVFIVLFAVVVTESPVSHCWVTSEELSFILEHQLFAVSSIVRERQTQILPVLKILVKSVGFWVIIIAQTGYFWGMCVTLCYLPKFLHESLGFDVTLTGLIGSGLILLYFGSLLTFAKVNLALKDFGCSLILVRKFGVFISHGLTGICFMIMYTVQCDNLRRIFLTLLAAYIFAAAMIMGHWQNMSELAGITFGAVAPIMLSLGGLGVCALFLNGYLFEAYSDKLQAANIVFLVCGALMAISAVPFMFFARSKKF